MRSLANVSRTWGRHPVSKRLSDPLIDVRFEPELLFVVFVSGRSVGQRCDELLDASAGRPPFICHGSKRYPAEMSLR